MLSSPATSPPPPLRKHYFLRTRTSRHGHRTIVIFGTNTIYSVIASLQVCDMSTQECAFNDLLNHELANRLNLYWRTCINFPVMLVNTDVEILIKELACLLSVFTWLACRRRLSLITTHVLLLLLMPLHASPASSINDLLFFVALSSSISCVQQKRKKFKNEFNKLLKKYHLAQACVGFFFLSSFWSGKLWWFHQKRASAKRTCINTCLHFDNYERYICLGFPESS